MIKAILKVGFGAMALLVLAGSVLGKDRVARGVHEAREAARQLVDEVIEPEAAARLTRRMEEIAREYPRRIAALQCELDGIDREERRLVETERLCERVIALCERDASALEASVDGAGEADPAARARALAAIEEVRAAYAERAREATSAREAILQERAPLAQAIAELRAEQAELSFEIEALERELGGLKRDTEAVRTLEARSARSIGHVATDELKSLRALRAEIATRRAEKQAELDARRRTRLLRDYERRAEAGGEGAAESESDATFSPTLSFSRGVR